MNDQQSRPKNSFKVFLSIFSGEEKEYVRQSAKKARIMFACIGAFVILIFFGCLVSAFLFFDSLMQGNKVVSIPVGIFWGLLVVNMYLLLLYTVSPSILPHKKNKAGSDNGLFTFSMFLRTSFMCLLAVIMAQPLNEALFSHSVRQSLNWHVQEEKAKMIVSSDEYIISQEVKDYQDFYRKLKTTLGHNELIEADKQLSAIRNKIKRDSVFVKQAASRLRQILVIEEKLFPTEKEKKQQPLLIADLETLINSEIESDRDLRKLLDASEIEHHDFGVYKKQLADALDTKLKNYEDLEALLSRTNFYIKKIQLIFYENPLSWLLTTLICLLFIVPIVMKYQVRRMTDYYKKRIKMEHDDVIARYGSFKILYSEILKRNVSGYNFSSLKRLNKELEKLKVLRPSLYRKLKREIKEEYKDEVFSKYEYWADNPFRTMPKIKRKLVTSPPVALMDFLYDSPETDAE